MFNFQNDKTFYTVKAENRQFEEAQAFIDEVLKLHNPNVTTQPLRKVQIAGTNGKGSTAAMLSSVLIHAGYKTGLYTSPSLVCVNERIRLNGEMISDADLCSYIPVIARAQEESGRLFGGFERITAASMLYYTDNAVDIAVMETGLGGRYDTVSAVGELILASVTAIGMDHMVMLGDSLDKIAMEKCGIMRQGIPTVVHSQKQTADAVVEKCASELDVRLIRTDVCKIISVCELPDRQKVQIQADGELYDHVIPLLGSYQCENAKNALLCALELKKQGFRISHEDICEGIASAKWDGRLQNLKVRGINSHIVVDGAHNPSAMYAVAEHMTRVYGDKKFTAVLAVMSDKDVDGVLCELARFAEDVVCLKVTPRSCDAEELAKMVEKHGMRAHCADDIRDALKKADALAKGEDIYALGSLYLAGAIIGESM